MYTSFYVKEERLPELKSFIRNELLTARFESNPQKHGDKWFIVLTMEVEDGNKLSQFKDKWYKEDNTPKLKKNGGFLLFTYLCNFIKKLLKQ